MLCSIASHYVSIILILNCNSFSLFSTAFESAALAEKLLNDLLKSTEAFNKLKKMNDQLKSQVGSET